MMPSGDEREALRAFSKETDRDSGRFFVGRSAELRAIADAAENWMAALSANLQRPPSGLILISGAPGAGKTALLHHIRTSDQEPEAIQMDLTDLGSEERLAQRIVLELERLFGSKAKQYLPQQASLNLGAVKFNWSLASQVSALRGLEQAFPLAGWGGPVLLLLDEVQSATAAQFRNLAALHRGATGLPLVPVTAGLSDSADVLNSHGISRRASGYGTIRLGLLKAGEPAEAIRMMLSEFGIQGPAALKRQWADRIEALSQLWPQHLKTAMTALAKEVLRTEGDLERADWDMTLKEAAALRESGYEARRSPLMRRADRLLAEFLSSAEWPLPESRAFDVLQRLMDLSPIRPMNANDLLMHLVHQGVLHDPDGKGEYVCPIPSFRDFLIRKGSA